MARAKAKSPYSVHPGIVMVQSWVISLPVKTGRSLDDWIRLVKKEGPPSEKERSDWLKANHGLGTNTGGLDRRSRFREKPGRRRSRSLLEGRRRLCLRHVRR